MTLNSYSIHSLIDKTKSQDKDLVYMAVVDLMNEFQKSTISKLEEDACVQIIDSLVRLLKDKNGDVQNLAIKCLTSFAKKCGNNHLVIILGILCDFFESNEGILEKNMLRDISFTVLRNIIIETPSPSPIAVTIVHFLFPKLLSQLMTDTVLENQMDIINVMIELLSRFSKYLKFIIPVILKTLKKDDDELRELTLQTLEIFIHHFDKETKLYIPYIVEELILLLNYDPNYTNNDINVEKESSSDESDNSDYYNDDISWRIRKYSCKLLNTIINTYITLFEQHYFQVAISLVQKFNEREEVVRYDILNTFTSLIRQTSYLLLKRSGNLDFKQFKENNASNIYLELPFLFKKKISILLPEICKALSIQLMSSSISTCKAGYVLITELTKVMTKEMNSQYQYFMRPIEILLASSFYNETSSVSMSAITDLRIEALRFVKEMLSQTSYYIIQPYLHIFIKGITVSIQNKFYKISAESLCSLSFLIKLLPSNGDDFEKSFDELYFIVLEKASVANNHNDVEENAMVAMGHFLIYMNLDENKQNLVLNILTEKLNNETTQLLTIKIIRDITTFRISKLDCKWVTKTVVLLLEFLEKNNKSLKLPCLLALSGFMKISENTLEFSVVRKLVDTIIFIIFSKEYYILSSTILLLVNLIKYIDISFTIFEELFHHIMHLIRTPLVQNSIEIQDKVLDFMKVSIKKGNSNYLFKKLFVIDVSFNEMSFFSKIIALILENGFEFLINNFIEEVKVSEVVKKKCFLLMVLGEYGRKMNMAQYINIMDVVFSQLFSSSDDLKRISAFALGNIIAGNISTYFPFFINQLQSTFSEYCLLLIALKEIIIHHDRSSNFMAYFIDVLNILFKCSISDENCRPIAAECIGRLALLKPHYFFPEFQKNIKNPSIEIQLVAISAIKFTFISSVNEFDSFLSLIIAELLLLVENSQLIVKKLIFEVLNIAIHNKFYLVQIHMRKFLAVLYEETTIKDNLMKKVQMGPFIHIVDDSFELRKSVYEMLYFICQMFFAYVEDISEFLDIVICGLDDCHDIKIFSNLILIKLCNLVPREIQTVLDSISVKYSIILNSKLKDTAIKHEIEKNIELRQSILRGIVALSQISNKFSTPRFYTFYNDLLNNLTNDEFKFVKELEIEDCSSFNISSK
ncbi:hypothetical protein MERGE_000461 [Pneumocystis wakefieldiae]|uniref:TATA-binding protein interacting (TIP20) domain-containing protein n=1 Tax=Pneumocystis wakefieldiae TaxID=38082 RepID=A0A899GBX9_9ASCO|nr:hypothetical protein MERGE_000461 [Pneumocystis wakefieldiae]